jgi:Skp family chaperone for outer membrane proteins
MNMKALGVAMALALLPMSAMAQSATPDNTGQAAERGKVRAACAADVQKFCANVGDAKGVRRECLKANEAKLSDGCKAARAERAAARAKEKS